MLYEVITEAVGWQKECECGACGLLKAMETAWPHPWKTYVEGFFVKRKKPTVCLPFTGLKRKNRNRHGP